MTVLLWTLLICAICWVCYETWTSQRFSLVASRFHLKTVQKQAESPTLQQCVVRAVQAQSNSQKMTTPLS